MIGVEIKVTDSKNKADIGIEGKVIDETRDTLMIETKKGVKRMIKDKITIQLKKEKITLKGSLLAGRPEDRIKKKI